MVGMEDTMRAIQKDAAEVKLMRRGLDAGLAKAVIVLEETRQLLTTSRKDREILLEQRKAEYKNAKVLQVSPPRPTLYSSSIAHMILYLLT
jgi:hypothetical protein